MIRRATGDDAAQIADIYNPYILTSTVSFEELAVSDDDIRVRIHTLQSSGFPFLVFDAHGEIEGYAYASQWKTRTAYKYTCEISVYIKPNAQGRGIAKALYRSLFETLRGLEFHSVIGVITLPNAASIHLHESFGLVKVAHFSEVGHKFGRWVDVGYWQGFLDPKAKNP